MISSDEHSNIMNDIVNVTSPLTATFSNLMTDTYYDVRVTTVYSRLLDGGTTTVNIRTSSPVPTQSNNTSNNGTDNPSSNNTGTYVYVHTHTYVRSYIIKCSYVRIST